VILARSRNPYRAGSIIKGSAAPVHPGASIAPVFPFYPLIRRPADGTGPGSRLAEPRLNGKQGENHFLRKHCQISELDEIRASPKADLFPAMKRFPIFCGAGKTAI
jgi:hypothetical protein